MCRQDHFWNDTAITSFRTLLESTRSQSYAPGDLSWREEVPDRAPGPRVMGKLPEKLSLNILAAQRGATGEANRVLDDHYRKMVAVRLVVGHGHSACSTTW